MKSNTRLSAQDHEFFSLVLKAIYMNPFLEERSEIEEQISPGYRQDGTIFPELNRRIENIEGKGLRKIQHFGAEDSRLMAFAYLYQTYLRYLPDLDSIIQQQLNQRDKPVDVPFAKQLVSHLKSRGFSDQDTLRYFAIFYQLRRAFYFISSALVGDSPSMKQLRLALWNNVFTNDLRRYDQHLWNRMEDFSTLLLGETGTGKGSAAAAIGRSGFIPFEAGRGQFADNFTVTFVATNLSQYPENLIESELFGHRKGAFTGAVDDHVGLFERCSVYGALFLDEIGDLTITAQIKLLQVLQERTFTPVGSHENKRFAGRVIAATNRSLDELRTKGKFRDDFFYRLCSDIITVPPLRQRIEESPSEMELLVNLLVTRITGQETPGLTDMVLETLKRGLPRNYPWPGNVRELEQAVRRVLMTRYYDGDLLVTEPDLEDEFLKRFQMGTLDARELLGKYCNLLYQRFGTYEEVARRIGMDRRTVKKYLQSEQPPSESDSN